MKSHSKGRAARAALHGAVISCVATLTLGLVTASTVAAQSFEQPSNRIASEILPAAMIAGSHHKVRQEVVSYGYMHHYTVDSDFGVFEAQGDAMLRRLVREIYALAAMKQVTSSEAFMSAMKEAAKSPFVGAKNLIAHPVDTVSGIPKGIFSIFNRVGAKMTTSRSEQEDGSVKSLLAVSSFKRDYARKLGIDVYTRNPAVQKELNRIGWAAAVGRLAPGLATMPIGGPAVTAMAQLRHVDQLNNVITEVPPQELSLRNRKALQGMGIDAKLIDDFLDQKVLSPRHKTIFVQSLAALSGARGRGNLVAMALFAETEVDALFYQQIAETMAGYHRHGSPIVETSSFNGLPIAYAANGSLVVAFPLDYGRWTQRGARIIDDLVKNHPRAHPVKRIEIWVTGTLSERAKQELAARRVLVLENADKKIGMMD